MELTSLPALRNLMSIIGYLYGTITGSPIIFSNRFSASSWRFFCRLWNFHFWAFLLYVFLNIDFGWSSIQGFNYSCFFFSWIYFFRSVKDRRWLNSHLVCEGFFKVVIELVLVACSLVSYRRTLWNFGNANAHTRREANLQCLLCCIHGPLWMVLFWVFLYVL